MQIFKEVNLTVVYTEQSDGNMKLAENRKKILEKIGFDEVYLPKQKHTNIVVPFANMDGPADGLYTDLKRVPIGVLTADCIAIVLTDFNSLVVLHAGWRGLVNGILQNGLKYFKDGAKFAFISPSIRSCCYEVGKEFYDILQEKGIETGYLIERDRSVYFDLQRLAKDILRVNDVKKIVDINLCSKCGENIFSYRNGNFDERILTFAFLE